MEILASIAIATPLLHLDKPYSYALPEGVSIAPGQRVMVPFGMGNQKREGVVLALIPKTDGNFKTIAQVLDDAPILSEQALRLAAWMRDRYFCTYFDCVRGMLPAGLWFQSKDRYEINSEISDWPELLKRKPHAVQVMNHIQSLGGVVDDIKLREAFPQEKELEDSLRYLLKKKVLRCDATVSNRLRDKTEWVVTLAVPGEDALAYSSGKGKSAPVQHRVLELLSTVGQGSSKEIAYYTGATLATLKRLEKVGLVTLHQEPVLAMTFEEPGEIPAMVRNQEQEAAFQGLKSQMTVPNPGVALLHGVTGSGKTAVYISLIQETLKQGKTAMVLVPEIGLTPQLLQKFRSFFGDKVAMLHSKLTMRVRYEQWKRVERGEATVVLGTRSAVFAPLTNLGLLILDEEQEQSYQADSKPRYDAREVAIYRGHKANALVLLGSATPSIETMYKAQTGKYSLFTLAQRYNQQELPKVTMVDMRQELLSGNGFPLGKPLCDAMEQAFSNGNQVILFLNRRGASRYVVCIDCGEAPKCPNCSVSLTYHSANHRMMCHHCGFSQGIVQKCPQCGGHFKQVGIGTQKLEEAIHQRFPDIATLRMDMDTISAVNTHEKMLKRFQDEKIPLLIGTQMVAKGLNFPNVTLVGVVDADGSLALEHYKAAENTFNMITQVVGRAGRGQLAGQAFLQTANPNSTVLELASKQDYQGFYQLEIPMRKLQNCPPFSTVFTIHFSGLFEERVRMGANRFRSSLEVALAQSPETVTLLGPVPEIITKINNQFRYAMTMMGHNTKYTRHLLSTTLKEFMANGDNKGINAYVDVNH